MNESDEESSHSYVTLMSSLNGEDSDKEKIMMIILDPGRKLLWDIQTSISNSTESNDLECGHFDEVKQIRRRILQEYVPEKNITKPSSELNVNQISFKSAMLICCTLCSSPKTKHLLKRTSSHAFSKHEIFLISLLICAHGMGWRVV